MFEKENECNTCAFSKPCAMCTYKNRIEDVKDHSTHIPMTCMSRQMKKKIWNADREKYPYPTLEE